MKDSSGNVIYVGKSRKLCARVSQYFGNNLKNPKTERMVSLVSEFDTISVNNENEALTLENQLIKLYKPRFNIKLKDSKTYPYIKLTLNEEYPRLVFTRKRENDGAAYYGPFSESGAVRSVIDSVSKIAGLPVCRHVFPRDIGKTGHCIYSDMHRCIAPCTGEVGREEYSDSVALAQECLSGSTGGLRRRLSELMKKASDEERYEAAAMYRDSISALDTLKERQVVVSAAGTDCDVFSLASNDRCTVVTVLCVRDGVLISKNDYPYDSYELCEDGGLTSFALEYYSVFSGSSPGSVLLDSDADETETESLRSALGAKFTGVRVETPKRGFRHDLCLLCRKNAEERLMKLTEEDSEKDSTLVKLAVMLGLEVVPESIEAYDISNFGDEQIYAAMVTFRNGKPSKKDYRGFRIELAHRDDYASVAQAIVRRYSHTGDGTMPDVPDLILIDGGAGHTNTAKAALASVGVSVPVFGMVKDEFHKTRTLTDGEHEIAIAREQSVFRLIYAIQEEVHRCAVSKSTSGKRRTLKRSSLEDIEGIGRIKASQLLSYFGGLGKVRNASLEELKFSGVGEVCARNVYYHFHGDKEKKGSGD